MAQLSQAPLQLFGKLALVLSSVALLHALRYVEYTFFFFNVFELALTCLTVNVFAFVVSCILFSQVFAKFLHNRLPFL